MGGSAKDSFIAKAPSFSVLRRVYENWVSSNAGLVSAAEESLRSILLLLPGRFSESELSSESVHTLVNLVSMYHRRILGQPHMPTTLLHSKDTQTIRRIRDLLGITQHLEVLLEMLARTHLRTSSKWKLVLAIESLKALCRILLLYHNRGHMLIQATHQEATQQLDLQRMDDARSSGSRLPDMNGEQSPFADLYDMYHRHGRGIHPHGRFTTSSDSGLFVDDSALNPLHVISELLHIVRPVLFVAVVLACQKNSWKPYLAALCTDVTSRALLGRLSSMSARQQDEVRRRLYLWFFYLLRSPFFELYTRLPLTRALKALSRFPLVGVFFENMADLAVSLQSHYFYSSAS